MSKRHVGGGDTHKNPVAKIPIIQIFFLVRICSFERHGIGSIRSTKSDTTLKMPELSPLVLLLKQRPVVINGFQSFSRGLHMKIFKNR